ncbi:hypothetical protein BDP81DRAFT_455385 [Colletotrichum phormii]|uniref:Uncharacterized protein n=1 Tax=Colletotrichum phormii TaxID=359342 RepID=A0AAI9ZF79_9PEZI|nr:uncharacterized protein BDP81DRAFT_455385 [Colletotrichum phormii]KAK1622356.1 hypothetical protein BDP81DRAFT_455385 [Colletotrichum phormii]
MCQCSPPPPPLGALSPLVAMHPKVSPPYHGSVKVLGSLVIPSPRTAALVLTALLGVALPRNGRIPFSAPTELAGLTVNYPRHYSPPAPGLECCIIAAILGRVMDSWLKAHGVENLLEFH